MDKTKIAIFVDVENLTQWVKEDGLEKLVNDLSEEGRIVTRKAYGVWSSPHIQKLQAPLNRLGFDLVHSFHPVSGKNSADIQLTMDVLENAIRVTDIEQIVLATGDSDFSPLFRRLREMGKQVLGVGPRSPLSESVKSSCTRYIYTDIAEEQDAQSELSEVRALIEELLEANAEPMPLSAIKNTLMTRDNAFDERSWGYPNFSAFMRNIPNLDIYQAENKTHWMAQFNPAVLDKSAEQATDITEQYRKFLRKMNWPFSSYNLIVNLHSALLGTEPIEVSDLKENLVQRVSPDKGQKLMRGATASDIRKGLATLFKAQLFDVTEDQQGNKYWQYKGDRKYIDAINNAAIARVQSACDKESMSFSQKQLEPLLYPVVSKEKAL
jgi:uncharacterized protein (TIGR00288 family)